MPLTASYSSPVVRGGEVLGGIACVEVIRDQSVVCGGEEGKQVGSVIWMAETGGGNIYVDDSELGSVNIDRNGLVLEVWV